MNKFAQLLTICIVISTAQITKADIEVNPGAMEIGTVTVLKIKRGKQSFTYMGPDGDLFYYEHRDLFAPKDGIFKHWRDSKGRLTRLEYFGRVIQTYAPHNCQFAIGRCEYTYVNENTKYKKRDEYKVIIIGEFTGEQRWSYKQYYKSVAPENLRKKGWVKVDKYGIDIESKSTFYRKTSPSNPKLKSSKGWRKRVSQELPAN